MRKHVDRSIDRRRFLALALGAAGLAAAAPAATQESRRTRVILLGTKGGPRVGPGRQNCSTLILAGDTPFVVDCGQGVSRQLAAAGVPLERLRHVFITHLHSDHMLEYGGLLYNAWAAGGRSRIDAWGPAGTERSTAAFFESMKFDLDTRIEDEGRPDLRRLVVAHDIEGAGTVMRDDGIRVSALRVKHPPIRDAYAFRFDAPDRSIVISGDTAWWPPLAEFARGADVLVHEAMYLPAVDRLLARVPNAATLREHLLASHTSTEDAGRIAAEAKVGKLVLSHLVPGDDPSITDELWIAGPRKHYAGDILVGRDGMEV